MDRVHRYGLGLVAGAWLATLAAGPVLAQASVVYYSQGNGGAAEKTFPYQVLKLALEKCGKAYVLRPSPIGHANIDRTTDAMVADGPIDVQWLGASRDADRKMSPVLFPIDMGLLGYRIFLIDKARQADFAQIRSLSDLRRMVALQGSGWPDVQILRSAGLTVRTAPIYPDLFKMLIGGRADYFPRGAFEAYNEADQFAASAPGLAVEDTLVVHYKYSNLFYVKKTDAALRDDLYRGLAAAFDDGSYRKLFLSNPDVQTVLSKAHLASRRRIEIQNPLLSPEVGAIDDRYWYRP